MMINYIHWNIDPVIFNLFGFSLRYYSLLFGGGLLISAIVLYGIFKKEDIPSDKFDKLYIYSFIGIFAGARLGHCLFYDPVYYWNHPLEIIHPIQSTLTGGYKYTGFQGLASHGGTIGLILALLLYSKKTKEPIVKTLDLIAVVAPLGAGFIRVANLMNSEIIGIPTTVPWAFVFGRVDKLPRHPAQLYEAIIYFMIFGLMYFLYRNKREKLQNGFLFGLVITLIFVARFFIEMIKEIQEPFEEHMKLDMGQLLSIPFIAAGIAFIIYSFVRTRGAKQ